MEFAHQGGAQVFASGWSSAEGDNVGIHAYHRLPLDVDIKYRNHCDDGLFTCLQFLKFADTPLFGLAGRDRASDCP